MEIILSAVYIFSAKGTFEAGELVNCFSGLQDMSSISETNLQKKKKKLGTLAYVYIAALGSQSQVSPWGSLASQPHLLGKVQANERF